MIIQDPLTGNGLRINDEGQAAADSTTTTLSHHANAIEAEYYTLTINQKATAADDCIGYVKNSSDENLHIESIYLYSATETLLSINLSDTGTPNTPTTLTPVNCNAGSGNLADGTFYQGADLDNAGANLSGGSNVLNWFTEAGKGELLSFHPMLILPKNATCTFWVNHNTTAVLVGLGMFYHAS